MGEISKDFAVVKKAEGITGGSSSSSAASGSKSKKPSAAERLEMQAEALVDRAKSERAQVPKEVKAADVESKASSVLLSSALGKQAAYNKQMAMHDKALAEKRKEEAETTLAKAAAAVARRRVAALAKLSKRRAAAAASSASAEEQRHTLVSSKRSRRPSRAATSSGPDPDSGADAVIAEEEKEDLERDYKTWAAEGGGSDSAVAISAFCSERRSTSAGQRECATVLGAGLRTLSAQQQLHRASRGSARAVVDEYERRRRAMRGGVCDPASPHYMRCLGVRATGATLSPQVEAQRALTIREAQRMVAKGLADLVAEKKARASKALGLDDANWSAQESTPAKTKGSNAFGGKSGGGVGGRHQAAVVKRPGSTGGGVSAGRKGSWSTAAGVHSRSKVIVERAKGVRGRTGLKGLEGRFKNVKQGGDEPKLPGVNVYNVDYS
jgi:hypothetical protein